MEQIARNLTGDNSFLAGKKYLIHDRDPLYTDKFDSILKSLIFHGDFNVNGLKSLVSCPAEKSA